MYKLVLAFSILTLVSCKSKQEKIKPTISDISESIYASGIIKSKNQYQAYATVNGIIQDVFVSEGDSVKIGTPILSISNETQKLMKEISTQEVVKTKPQQSVNDSIQSMNLYYDYQIQNVIKKKKLKCVENGDTKCLDSLKLLEK